MSHNIENYKQLVHDMSVEMQSLHDEINELYEKLQTKEKERKTFSMIEFPSVCLSGDYYTMNGESPLTSPRYNKFFDGETLNGFEIIYMVQQYCILKNKQK